jgi:drug/metabolite transporter (DMT)-like permease
MFFWAGNFAIGRWIAGQVPPFTMTALRWTGAALLAFALYWKQVRDDWPVIRSNIPILALLALFGAGSFNALQYIALGYTTATTAGVINSTSPAMIAVVSYLLLGEEVCIRRLAGITMSFVGAVVVLAKGDLEVLSTLTFNRGDIILLFAMGMWAIYTALLGRRPPMQGGSFVAVSFAIAALINIPLAVTEELLGARMVVNPATVSAILYTATLPSVLAYMLFNRGVEIIGPTRAGAFMHLVPLFTALLGMAFLGESPALYHIVGLGLILGGVWFAAR